MKLNKDTKMIVVGLGLLLSFILTNFRPSGSHPAAQAKSVLLLDISGKPLSSVFERLPADPRYPEFKRLAEKRLLTCSDKRSNFWSRFRTTLGLSFETVVYAQNACGGCGFVVVNDLKCASACGAAPAQGHLEYTDPSNGTTNGPTVCKNSSGQCPGEPTTVNCECSGGDCTPPGGSCSGNPDCCSGWCDDSDFFCH